MEKRTTLKYYPHATQKPFHQDRYKVPYRGLIAGTGSGKTIAGVFEDLSWCIENPGCVGYIFEPTYPMVRRILLPTLRKLLGTPIASNPIIKSYNKVENLITLEKDTNFEHPSLLWLGSLEDPERAEGPNIDFIHVDEARLIRHFDTALDVIQRRLRGSGGDYPIGLWITTTPNAPGSALFNFLENPKTRNPLSKVYRMSLFDNKDNLPKEYIDNIIRTHTGGMYKRFVEGLFADVSLGSFSFDYSVHVLDKIPGKPVIRKIIYGVDFGWTNPSCILAIGLDNDGRAYVLEEFYQSMVHGETLIQEALTMQGKWGKGPFVCDSAEPRTIDLMIKAGLGARANKSKRDEGIREVGGRFKKAGDGKARIYIHKNCVNLIEELQIYDESKKEHDHAVDALRYALASQKKEGAIDAFKFR